jgi:hypothetical protein
VSQLNGLRDDLYVVVGAIDPESKRATFRVHVNPLVAFIWIGVLVLIGGAAVSLWPDVSLREVGAWGYVRAGAGLTSSIMFAILLASTPASAVEHGRDAVSRQHAERLALQQLKPDAEPASAAVVREALSGVTRNAGFSVLGGLLVGATVAWAARGRRQALAR